MEKWIYYITDKQTHTHTHEGEYVRESGRDLPAFLVTKRNVDRLQPYNYLLECWAFVWLLIPALFNQPIHKK